MREQTKILFHFICLLSVVRWKNRQVAFFIHWRYKSFLPFEIQTFGFILYCCLNRYLWAEILLFPSYILVYFALLAYPNRCHAQVNLVQWYTAFWLLLWAFRILALLAQYTNQHISSCLLPTFRYSYAFMNLIVSKYSLMMLDHLAQATFPFSFTCWFSGFGDLCFPAVKQSKGCHSLPTYVHYNTYINNAFLRSFICHFV